MNILITGATGFIGTALCKEMTKGGHNVTAVIRPNSFKRQRLPKEVSVIELPIDKLSELKGSYDLFYHLAWNGSSGNDRNNFDIQNSNIQYTADAIRAAKRCGCHKFIGAGSQAEYGVVHGLCSEDTTVPNPFMMYGSAKLASYHMGRVLAEQLGIALVWPRIYSVYGIGENDGTLISYVIKSLKEGKVPELSACENMWDFMYITDCTKALRILGENEKVKGVYNISAGKPRILREFVEEIRDIVNQNSCIQFGAKEVDLKRTFWLEPDVTKLKKVCESCEVNFEMGIRKIIKEE
ncbi:epimerase [Clostridium sp. 2-1]|uniref:NAD-dependent epimerase/dehydratase family protein n=1 Tax=Clostridium TaxID=1485 RepID=UPI000CDA9F82|nr:MULTISPECIES: NAD-dependent epimerase/dehydratase family protein [Clostridium]MBN7573059.1 NAD-dependent epimerase/dehydratase family protein [Clostridium beijerinckii]MBN7578398.1 NAD-dependent epimerase/dehydratase family protein [Clostridium beijerinckii]MBN7582833.1 NAD-dependent epimerase/dehydratase family protein [Clostridium beijerinckii]MBO0518998.1 NAD-dependent epimerase/dehydratase family protein [Clostridium beijerinckii]POO93263.1 epimerase [Clostridium sp. 2-1]